MVVYFALLTKKGSISQFSDSDDAVAKIFFNINFTVPTAFSDFPLAAEFWLKSLLHLCLVQPIALVNPYV